MVDQKVIYIGGMSKMSVDKFLSDEYLADLNAYWRAANYLAATQLYYWTILF